LLVKVFVPETLTIAGRLYVRGELKDGTSTLSKR
jgi:hypothetical protein